MYYGKREWERLGGGGGREEKDQKGTNGKRKNENHDVKKKKIGNGSPTQMCPDTDTQAAQQTSQQEDKSPGRIPST